MIINDSPGKAEAEVIKGVAILLMLVHHFFTFPKWIIVEGYKPNIEVAALLRTRTNKFKTEQ